jgi:hypothetical protein
VSERVQIGSCTLYRGDCRDVLSSIGRVDACVTDLSAGTAAEHLVCADLLLGGWRAFLADQNCPYDVAVDIGGRLVRIQVKATRRPRAIPQRRSQIPAYMWHVRRAGKAGRRTYGENDFDLLALVALDIRQIAYLPPSTFKQTVHIRPPGATGGKQFDQFTFPTAIRSLSVRLREGDLFVGGAA